MTGLLAAALLAAAPAAAQPVPRKVLVLYRAAHIPGKVKDVFFTPAHQRAELPLNWLGLEAEYVDADGPLPGPEAFRGARGVLAWLPAAQAFPDPRPVCRWLGGAMRSGLRVVLWGNVGLLRAGAPGALGLDPECGAVLSELGVEYKGSRWADPLSVRTVHSDPRLLGFERKPDPSEQGNVEVVRLKAGATAYLRLEFDDDDANPWEPVGVSPRGGVALNPFLLYANEGLTPQRFAWVIDPFEFLSRALALGGLPRPDPTTANGLRLYMSHVDGDGFFNVSELDRRKTAGRVFVEEFLAARPESPFTVSLIAGYYDLALYKDEDSLAWSRRALERGNVEPAAHGYSHPLIWRTMAPALKIPGYEPDAGMETGGAARLLEERVLEGGRVGLHLWTGDCLPSEADVKAAEEAGLIQMNGGGGRFDALHPSYAYLLPLSRRVGAARQIYSPSSNENEFTNLWSGPYYGYRDAVTTYRRSGAPRRVKPVDVYVHFYSAERYASLGALRKVYEWAHAQPLHPVFAGDYARAARAFFEMRVSRLGPRRFRLEGGAALRTVRFDGEAGEPDLTASKGVLGFKRELDSLYVHLDGSESREVALAARPARRPYLEEANFAVESWEVRGGGLRFAKRGWWTSRAVLAGLAPGRAYRARGAGLDARLNADATGRLLLEFPDSERGRPAREVAVEPL